MLAELPPWAAITVLTAAGGVLSAAAAGIFLRLPEKQRQWAIPHLLSYATGALLGAALLGLVPEAIEASMVAYGAAGPARVGTLLLAGILLFFVLEKLVLWRHCHEPEHDHGFVLDPTHEVAGVVEHEHTHRRATDTTPLTGARARAAAMLALTGDTLHNFIDGVIIAVAWLSDPGVGIATAVAVFAHEVPQEIGDLAVLLHGGFSRARAFLLNTLSSLAAVAGGITGLFALSFAGRWLPDVMTVAAASLLYVAVADLIPGLHRRAEPRAALVQLLLMAAGLATVVLLHPAHP